MKKFTCPYCYGEHTMCQETSKQFFCPMYEEEEIPSVFLSRTGLSIALLGAAGSGKSSYIGVLMKKSFNPPSEMGESAKP